MNESNESKPSSSSVYYQSMLDLLGELKNDKPNDRTDLDRRYAIVITDFEKVISYYKYYVVEGN